MKDIKDTNPKDAVGTRKVPFSTISWRAMAEIGLAMLEGGRKYGRHNYREAGVRASVYFDSTLRHLVAWWEGEDIDPDSGLSHVTKAIAGLMVLRDSMLEGNWVDDRPPKVKAGWIRELNKKASEIIDKYPDAVEPYTQERVENKIKETVKSEIKAGDKVRFIKAGKIGWETTEWCKELVIGNIYTVIRIGTPKELYIKECDLFLHTDHFEKVQEGEE
jgi:hypothetical protein